MTPRDPQGTVAVGAAHTSSPNKFRHCLGPGNTAAVLKGSFTRALDHLLLGQPSPPYSGSLSMATSSFCPLCRACCQWERRKLGEEKIQILSIYCPCLQAWVSPMMWAPKGM